MTEHIQQVKYLRNGGLTTETTRTVTDDETTAPLSTDTTATAARAVWYIAGVIIGLLAIRFVFILLGANRGNGFVDLAYSLSYPFAAPFFGIFGYTLRYGVSRFELSTLVAMGIYALIAWGVARLITIRRGAM
jgi:hypothetical protein